MEFKVGDKVRRKLNMYGSMWTRNCQDKNLPLDNVMTIKFVKSQSDITLQEIEGDAWDTCNFELVAEASLPNVNKMTRKIINVLVVDKKTGKIEKNSTVVADNEQHAILKAFGIDAENVYIKTVEQGSYEEEKPVKIITEQVKK